MLPQFALLLFLCTLCRQQGTATALEDPETSLNENYSGLDRLSNAKDRAKLREYEPNNGDSLVTMNTRVLLQDPMTSNDRVQCSLSRRRRREYLNEETRTWLINDQGWNAIERDLQVIVNCTIEGDIISFNVTNVVHPTRRVTIPWNLTLGGVADNIRPIDSDAAIDSHQSVFECPDANEGLFLITYVRYVSTSLDSFNSRSKSVRLANLLIRHCLFEGNQFESIVEIAGCRSNRQDGVVQLHNVTFTQNLFMHRPALTTNSPSCSQLELIDVSFVENSCSNVCAAQLASKSRLRNVRLLRNNRVGTNGVVMLQASDAIEIDADQIEASENSGSVFSISHSNFVLSQSRFYANEDSCNGKCNSTSVVYLHHASAVISSCLFERNRGRHGSAFNIFHSDLSLRDSELQQNSAIDGGAIYVSMHSRAVIRDCWIWANKADHHGGAILATESSTVVINNGTIMGNRATRGGFLTVANRSRIDVSATEFALNEAMFGGALSVHSGSRASMFDVLFTTNGADSFGGSIYSSDAKSLHLRDCRFLLSAGRSTYGGFIYATRSGVQIADSTFEKASAELGGCLYMQHSDVEFRNVSVSECESDSSGAVAIIRGRLNLDRVTMESNKADFGAALASLASKTKIRRSVFVKNRSQVSGGCIVATARGFLTIRDSIFRSNRAMHAAAFVASEKVRMYVKDCAFRANIANYSGGVAHIAEAARVDLRRCVFVRNRSKVGGAVSTVSAHLNVTDSICTGSRSRFVGGCFAFQDEGSSRLDNVTIINGSALHAGAVAVLDGAYVEIVNSRLSMNSARRRGGAILVRDAEVSCHRTHLSQNKALIGGAVASNGRGVLSITSAVLSSNTADTGASIDVRNGTVVVIRDTHAAENRAAESGGVLQSRNSTVTVSASVFANSRAWRLGGCFMAEQSDLILHDTQLIRCMATFEGGAIYANDSRVKMRNVSIERSEVQADSGGGVSLHNSVLGAAGIAVRQCRANTEGGAMRIDNSSMSCTHCTFAENIVYGKGGAISARVDSTLELAIRLVRCRIIDNRARIAGGVHFISRDTQTKDVESDHPRSVLRLDETDFQHNSAALAGGAMLVDDANAILFKCRSNSRNKPRQLKKRWQRVVSPDHVCSEWRSNEAVGSAPIVGTYVKTVTKTFHYEESGEYVPVKENRYTIADHKSGTILPVLDLAVFDALGQPNAVGFINETVRVTMLFPDGLFREPIIFDLNNGVGRPPSWSGFHSPGIFLANVTFSETVLEPLLITVEIRDCTIGETVATNNTACTPCGPDTYSFDPHSEEGCKTCPENGNCEGNAIVPDKGYWHPTPCSIKLYPCLIETACDFEGRKDAVLNLTAPLKSCQPDNETLQQIYRNSQCREGYDGPLCGSCQAAFGHTVSYACQQCFAPYVHALLIVLVALVLAALSGMTIRSNLVSEEPNKTEGIVENELDDPAMATRRRIRREATVRARILSTARSGNNKNRIQATLAEERAKQTELAKWKAAEFLKVAINYAQIVAVAIGVNTNWTTPLIRVFEIAEFAGAVTSEATSLSVDCLIDDDAAVPRPVQRVIINAAIPKLLVVAFCIFWIFKTVRNQASRVYLAKRCVLSFIAVSYVSYIAITKNAMNVLSCVDVYNEADSVQKYWTVDTSVACFDSAHTALVATIGIPTLILFSFLFPAGIVAILLYQSNRDNLNDPFLYESCSFLYRSYRSKYVFWESVILSRKALIAVVVTFFYPLGGNLQGLLSVCILMIALYSHTVCKPYRLEFVELNCYEEMSLLISSLTFASGLFFNDNRGSEGVRLFVSILIITMNVLLLMALGYAFWRAQIFYCRRVLADEHKLNCEYWSSLMIVYHFLQMLWNQILDKISRKQKEATKEPQNVEV